MTHQGSLFGGSILEHAEALAQQIADLPEAEAIQMLNQVRWILHQVSPLKEHPVDYVVWVKAEEVVPNTYNPNTVPPPEMELLKKSLQDNGFAMPIVSVNENEIQEDDVQHKTHTRIIVDGEHRGLLGKKDPKLRKQTKGYLPITHIRPGRYGLTSRMAATIQFNAHGEPSIEGLTEMLLTYVRRGWDKNRIAKELVMEPDHVLRLMQQVGFADAWKDGELREAWDMVEMLPLSKILKMPVIDPVACAEWEGKNLVVKRIPQGLYCLSIDGKDITRSEEKEGFASADEIEGVLQQTLPSYERGASLWCESWNEWGNDDADLPDLVVPSPE